jgi:hypothetical protein
MPAAASGVLGYRSGREHQRREARARQNRDLVKGVCTFHNVTKSLGNQQ